MKTVSITIDESLLKALDQGIKEAVLPGRSEAIRLAVRDWLQKQALKKKIKKELDGYKKYPVTKDEFGPWLDMQEPPE